MIAHRWVVASLITAAVALAGFIATYARVRWWRSGSGQNVMALSALLFAVAVCGALYRTYPWFTVASFVPLWFAIAAVITWRTVLLIRAQRQGRGAPTSPSSPPPAPRKRRE